MKKLLGVLTAAVLLMPLPASAWSPSRELVQYQQAISSSRVQKNIAVWDIWQMQAHSRGTRLGLRGMVDGTMTVAGKRSFFLRVGVHRIPIQTGDRLFDASPGVAVYCVATVGDTRQFPPEFNLDAYVRSDEMVAWQKEQDRLAQVPVAGSRRTSPHWSEAWAGGNEAAQLKVACEWIQSFNHSLDDPSAMTWARTIFAEARTSKIDPRLAMSLMAAESAYQASAVSSVGAQGLGQLMPDTATRLGVANPFDPVQNIHGAIRYMGQLMDRWSTSQRPLSLVLASYNAGEGAVQQYGGIPPYSETQNYVAYVLSLYRELGGKGT